MKINLQKYLRVSILPLIAVLFFCTCKKNSDTATIAEFTWVHNGTTHTTTTDTAFIANTGLAYPPYTILAGYPKSASSNVIQKRVEFNLTSFTVGTYTIVSGNASANKFSYNDDAGNNLNGVSGTLNITANSNNQISGNFSGALVDGSSVTSTLTGNFTNMSIRP